MYLKVLSNMLLQSLRLHLKHPLKKKIEQKFIHLRLQQSDRQFYLDLNRSLWQSYLNIGSQTQLWPVRFYDINCSPTNCFLFY